MESGIVTIHPNRDKAESKTARAVVMILFSSAVVLMLVIMALGWSVLEGMLLISFGYVLIYSILVWRIGCWARGPLAVGAALAILLAIFASIAIPTWADRDAPGYAEPEAIWGGAGLSPGALGLITTVLVVLQLVTVAACLWAFRQEWQVEVETAPGEPLASPGTA